MIIVALFLSFLFIQNLQVFAQSQNRTFVYNLTSTNEDRALLLLESNQYSALYASLAQNETYPNIVYYGIGLDAGRFDIRLNAFMNDTGSVNRVFVNATIHPERLIEYTADGEETDNQIVFANTSTGWGPIGTGILNIDNTTLIPDGLLSKNVTILNVQWTGPQQDANNKNITCQFNIFISPPVEPVARLMPGMNATNEQLKNLTGVVMVLRVNDFPFKTEGGRVVLRSGFRVNETVYSVEETVQINLEQSVPFLFLNDTLLSQATFVNRSVLNLVRDFSRRQLDQVNYVGGIKVMNGTSSGQNDTIIVQGVAVNLAQVQSVLPRSNNAGSKRTAPRWIIVLLIAILVNWLF